MEKTLGQIAHEAGEKAGGWSRKWEHMGDGQRAEWEAIAEAVARHERAAAELRCAKTPVLLAGHHGYTALKVQEMMMAAVSMRSNAASSADAKRSAGMKG